MKMWGFLFKNKEFQGSDSRVLKQAWALMSPVAGDCKVAHPWSWPARGTCPTLIPWPEASMTAPFSLSTYCLFHRDFMKITWQGMTNTWKKLKANYVLYTVGERELSLYPLKFQQPSLRNELTDDRLTGKNHFNYLYPKGSSTKYETRERSDDLSL